MTDLAWASEQTATPPLPAEVASRPPDRANPLIDIGAMLAPLAMGVLAFGPVFTGALGYRAAGLGVMVGVLVAIASWRFRWGAAATLGVFVIGYLAVGGAAALPKTTIGGIIPSLDTLQRLILLSVQSWRDLLTVSLPPNDFVGPAVMPFLAAAVASVLTVSLALRSRHPLFALVPAGLLLVAGILWGSKEHPLGAVQGVVFAGVGLGWAAWRQTKRAGRDTADGVEIAATGSRGLPGPVAALALLAVAAVIAAVGGTALLGPQRHTLRDDVVPPLDPHAYASPLTQYRYLETGLAEHPLFTVTGLPKGARVALATMDAYDGIVYNVGDASASYLRVGTAIETGPTPARPTRLGFTIAELTSSWVPGGGEVSGLKFAGSDADQRAASLYYNSATGTLLSTVGIASGSAYTVDVTLPRIGSPGDLGKRGVRTISIPADHGVPDIVAATASDLAGDAATPYAQLQAIEKGLRERGFFDGTQSRSGHTAERIASFLEGKEWIGDDEQYAVAMALMARSLGIPARVVMGFYPDAKKPVATPLTITGDDAHVWVEVPFEPNQWARFDPTPERHRTPQQQVKTENPQSQPQVLAPPEPPHSDVDRPSGVTAMPRTELPDLGTPLWRIALRLALIGLATLLVVAAPFLTVLALKRRRRRRRRTAPVLVDRFAGGWDEVTDAALDLGVPTSALHTRQERAVALGAAFPEAGSLALAQRIDQRVFAGIESSEEDVRALWGEVDDVLGGLFRSRSRWRRLRARFSIRSLRAH